MNSSKNLLLILLSLAALILSTNTVYSSWTYYEGSVDPVSSEIKVSLKDFLYDYEVHEGFDPDDHTGINGSLTIDKILDSETGVNNPNNELNHILQDSNNFPRSGFVTSIDTKNLTFYDVDAIKETLGIDSSSHYLIQSVNKMGWTQLWYVYTTDFPITDIKILEGIDSEGKTYQYYSQEYIYDVYRTEVKWVYDSWDDKGDYTIEVGGTRKGYATSTINPENNNKQPFFSPSTWREGSFIKCDNIEINVPDVVYMDEIVKLNATFTPSNATKQDVVWKSSNNKVAFIDKDGYLHPKGAGEVTITLASEDLTIKPVNKKIKIMLRDNENLVAPTDLKIEHNNLGNNVVMGQTIQLNANVSPSNAYNKNVKWSTSDESIATINEDGQLTVKNSIGSKEVTVYAESVIDSSIQDSYTFIVNQPLSNHLIDGQYKKNSDNTLRFFNAKEVQINSSDVLFTDQYNNQAIQFTIPKNTNINKVKVTINSNDKNAKLTGLYYTLEDNRLLSDLFNPSSKEFTLTGSSSSDMTYYMVFSAKEPISYTITLM